jgi:hypothetical protein
VPRSKEVVDEMTPNPKPDIQARGGNPLLTRMLAYNNKLIQSMLIIALKNGKNIEISTHPLYVSMDNFRSMEMLKAICNVL